MVVGELSALADAITIGMAGIQDRLKIVRTRSAPTEWHKVIVKAVSFVPGTYRPDKPTWSYRNELATRISLRRISLTFNDAPDADWQPIIEIHADQLKLVESENNAFSKGDLDIDLYGGKTLPRDTDVNLFVWNKATGAQTQKNITVFAQFGEY